MTEPTEIQEEKKPKHSDSGDRFYATGRRKSAIARVWLIPGGTDFDINGKSLEEYFETEILRLLVRQPLETGRATGRYKVVAKLAGGGVAGQAGALRLGIARALVKTDESLKSILRKGGFLTRDPREKERKKFGRKGARRRFQYVKR
ncbi:MAG: 30S ribosomal protein S9 [Candidatus Omnitrophica bacterium]|nr:30S ribosomal protein S9 [Candidatus Omnitrophota bacterium]